MLELSLQLITDVITQSTLHQTAFEDQSRFAIWYLYATSAIIKREKKEFDEYNYHSDMKIFDIKA